jgi:CheY-like chemotaxis protein
VFDAITLDLLLPDVHGSAVLRDIRTSTLNHDTPVIIVTVIPQEDIGLGFAIQDCLLKPVKGEDLLAAVRRTGVGASEGQTVLIVDDDFSIRRLLEVTLKEAGFNTVCLSDAESALQSVAETAPGAIVLDLLMPGMDGFAFLHRLRRTPLGRRIPVVVMTSKDLSDADRSRLEATAQAVVLKGAGGDDALLTELKAWLRVPAAARTGHNHPTTESGAAHGR